MLVIFINDTFIGQDSGNNCNLRGKDIAHPYSWKFKCLRLKVHTIVQYLEVQNDPHEVNYVWGIFNIYLF